MKSEAEQIAEAVESLWAMYEARPSAIYVGTPFGCLCVSAHEPVLVGDEGEVLEDQSNAAAAFAYVQNLMEGGAT
jgi:hypothetical protein